MQDIEFTVERGRLFMLQTRSGKRTCKGGAAHRVDMADEGLITQERRCCASIPRR
jgi:pyruvate,orthophosphate dikinase